MSMIVHHDFQQNIVSDVELGQNALDSNLKGVRTLVSDGGYYSPETVKKACSENIELSFSALNGRSVSEDSLSSDGFIFDDNKKIIKCPGGFKPLSSKYDEEKQAFTAWFSKQDCARCELSGSCIFKEQKKFNVVRFTEKKLIADQYRNLIGTERHRKLADFRAGTEGIPSVLRRTYSIDKLPVRGLKNSRIWSNLKVIAYNFKSFYKYCIEAGIKPCVLNFFYWLFGKYANFTKTNSCYC